MACALVLSSLAACSNGGAGSGDTTGGGGSSGGTADAGPTVDCSTRPVDAPSTRSELGGFWDQASQRLIVYGGNLAVATACSVPNPSLTFEMWAFYPDCATWELLAPATDPGARARFGGALDTTRNRWVIFGGRTRPGSSYRNMNDTWAYDVAAGTWSELPTTGDTPTAVSSPAVAYDAQTDSLWVFGGNSSTSGLTLTGTNRFFRLSLADNVWTEITAPDAPSPRLYHSAAVVGRELVVFGGTPTFDGPFMRDAHAYHLDNGSWRLVSNNSGPDNRFGAEVFPDAVGGRLLVFGGHDDAAQGNRNDLWALQVATGTWTNLLAGDQLSNTGNISQCEFPADFTTVEAASPERRYSFVHTESAGAGYIFGGKTDCGAVNDVWKLDVAAGAWTLLRPSSGGEGCLRSGNLNCTTLCF